jgi:hypothetical protein
MHMFRRIVAGSIVAAFAAAGWAGDVDFNARVAQHNMRSLAQAFNIYYNDNNGPPTDLTLLYPRLVPKARTFWHPGDSDPAPTSIDNSTPNAPNSARISFDWPLYAEYSVPDATLIADNTPANNAGRFINMLTNDGVIETDPPLATKVPTAAYLARRHLERIAKAMRVYSNDNLDYFPETLKHLWDAKRLVSPRSFWNPGDPQPLPTDITSNELNGAQSAQISFEYLAGGLRTWEVTADTVLLRDNSVDNNDGFGLFVVYGDGRVVFEPDCPGDVNGDKRVTLTDLVILLRHWGLREAAYPRDGDINADTNVDFEDLRILLAHWGDDCRSVQATNLRP